MQSCWRLLVLLVPVVKNQRSCPLMYLYNLFDSTTIKKQHVNLLIILDNCFVFPLEGRISLRWLTFRPGFEWMNCLYCHYFHVQWNFRRRVFIRLFLWFTLWFSTECEALLAGSIAQNVKILIFTHISVVLFQHFPLNQCNMFKSICPHDLTFFF